MSHNERLAAVQAKCGLTNEQVDVSFNPHAVACTHHLTMARRTHVRLSVRSISLELGRVHAHGLCVAVVPTVAKTAFRCSCSYPRGALGACRLCDAFCVSRVLCVVPTHTPGLFGCSHTVLCIASSCRSLLNRSMNHTRSFVHTHTSRVQALLGMKGIEFDLANRMVENVITTISIPVGVATNVIVDGVERL